MGRFAIAQENQHLFKPLLGSFIISRNLDLHDGFKEEIRAGISSPKLLPLIDLLARQIKSVFDIESLLSAPKSFDFLVINLLTLCPLN